jgi:hypothetical protein
MTIYDRLGQGNGIRAAVDDSCARVVTHLQTA